MEDAGLASISNSSLILGGADGHKFDFLNDTSSTSNAETESSFDIGLARLIIVSPIHSCL